jgi:hypothetical protein
VPVRVLGSLETEVFHRLPWVFRLGRVDADEPDLLVDAVDVDTDGVAVGNIDNCAGHGRREGG